MIEIKVNGKWYDLPKIIEFCKTSILPSHDLKVKSDPSLPDLELWIKLTLEDAATEPSVIRLMEILSKLDEEQLGFVDAIIKSNLRVDINKVIKEWAPKRAYQFYSVDMTDEDIGEVLVLTSNPQTRWKNKFFDLEKFVKALSKECNFYVNCGFMLYGDKIKPGIENSGADLNKVLTIEVVHDTQTCKDFTDPDQRRKFVQYLADNDLLDSELTIKTNLPWFDLSKLSISDLTTLVNGLDEFSSGFVKCLFEQAGSVDKMIRLLYDFKYTQVSSLSDILQFWIKERPTTVEQLMTEKAEDWFDFKAIAVEYKKRFKLNVTNACGTYLMV